MRRLQYQWLERFESVPFTAGDLKGELADYEAINMKLSRLVKEGVLVRLRKGFYCVSSDYSSKLIEPGVIANALYGPSYVSFETALAHYGLIPEHVYVNLSAVLKHGEKYKTPLGEFHYYQMPENVFGIGVQSERTKNGAFLMANPTKALCDTLWRKGKLRVTSPKTLRSFLEEDLRFDFDYLENPDFEVLHAYATCGRKEGLFKALERMFHDNV